MSRSRYLTLALAILLLGGTLRTMWLRADPPIGSPGIVWHDEGPWTHNARNKVLFGAWQTDEWNPVFIAPVFTAFEYVSFRTFGVGTWQARIVPVVSGIAAIALLMAGLAAVANRRAALIGGAVLATNYAWVMWNRAALMESTMTAFIVMAWAAYAMAARRPVWGLVAGVATSLAFFTKASAAFFVAALVADAAATVVLAMWPALRARLGMASPSAEHLKGAGLALVGLAAAGLIIGVAFVWPHWTDYQFYNWEMSVERKPAYDLKSLKDRASWLPIVQDVFTRMWLVVVGAAIAILGMLARWRESRPAERLLVLWVFVGLLELTIHDSGNWRRYVMFIPALIALASIVAGSGARWLPAGLAGASWRSRLIALPFVLLLGYLVFGSIVRLAFLERIHESVGDYSGAVWTSAGLAGVTALVALAFWVPVITWLSARRVTFGVAVALVVVSLAWNLTEYSRWAVSRAEHNYEASVALGRILAPGTLVHGKLANGMALENQIRPVFIGKGFGNYDDRFDRDDVRYILTYDLPQIGYESQEKSGLIREILDHYPNRAVVATFEVDETPGVDRAVLIDKHPRAAQAVVSGSSRARD